MTDPMCMLLKYAGIEFEDILNTKREWLELNEGAPFGQTAKHEKPFGQNKVVARCIAKSIHLTGGNICDDLEIDAIVDTIQDFKLKLIEYYFEEDTGRKSALRDALVCKTVPAYFERLDKIAHYNNGHLASGKLTWADIYFVGLLDGVNFVLGDDVLGKYTNLVAVKNNLLQIPIVKAWMENRRKD